MNITLYCPNLRCRMVLEVPEKTRGRRVRCSRCGTNFMVPTKAGDKKPAADKGARSVHFGEDGRHEARIFERDLLPAGFEAAGPLIVEEPSATTIVHPGQQLRVDELGFLHISAM